MDTSIELRYAGVVIGRATAVGETEGDRLFLALPDPLPIGTKVSLTIDERVVEGRVIAVSESTDLAKSGMRIQLTGPAATSPSVSGAGDSAAASGASGASPSDSPSPSPSPSASGTSDTQAAGDDGAGDGLGATNDGVPVGDDPGGQSGVAGGRRRRRKR